MGFPSSNLKYNDNNLGRSTIGKSINDFQTKHLFCFILSHQISFLNREKKASFEGKKNHATFGHHVDVSKRELD